MRPACARVAPDSLHVITRYPPRHGPPGISATADHYLPGATYQATPKWAVTDAGFYIHAGEGGGDVSHEPASHAMPYALGTTYDLSGRTFVYGTVAYVNNSKSGTFCVFATPRDLTTPTSPMAGQSQTGAYEGMMHVF